MIKNNDKLILKLRSSKCSYTVDFMANEVSSCTELVACGPMFFFINNIYFNICSKSTKGSSRELMLFTMYIKKRIRLHVTIKQDKKKTHAKYWKLAETVGQRNKRLDILKQPNVSLKISIRNTI